MLDSTNPYLPPQTLPSRPKQYLNSYSKGLFAASAITGGLATASAIYLIYVNDSRIGVSGPKLEVAIAGGTALSSAIWALSGWLQRGGAIGLVITLVIAAMSAGLWIVLFGTYADVLGAAACVAWPCGGFVASVFVYRSRKMNHDLNPQNPDGG